MIFNIILRTVSASGNTIQTSIIKKASGRPIIHNVSMYDLFNHIIIVFSLDMLTMVVRKSVNVTKKYKQNRGGKYQENYFIHHF